MRAFSAIPPIRRTAALVGGGGVILPGAPDGLVWAINGSSTGTTDSDTNLVIDSLNDLIGSNHFVSSATSSKKPRAIPEDYLFSGRKSVLFANGATSSQEQYLYDETTDNEIWKPLWRHELSGNTGATLVVSFVPRGDNAQQTVFSNFSSGGAVGPGVYINWTKATGVLTIATFKNGVLLTVSTAGTSTQNEICTVVIVAGADNTYSHRVNGAVVASGTTSAAAAEQSITVPITIACQPNSAGATNGFGGNLLFAGLYHRPLTSGECAELETAIEDYYTPPSWTADSSPVSGVSVASVIDIAVCGTSIDAGQDDASGGYVERLKSAGLGSGLTATFVGGRKNYAVATTDVMAVGGMTIRGVPSVPLLGFDSVSVTSHAGRFDVQLAAMETAGMLGVGRTLVCVIPVGWVNDLYNPGTTKLLRDHQGDLVRMIERFHNAILAIDGTHDVRFVLCSATPHDSSITDMGREIVKANLGTRQLATKISAVTGRPVAVADFYTVINSDRAAYMAGDELHLSSAGHAALVTPIKNAIRYVCGRS